ncbi:hypothetical protein I4F81_010938 [Pyropia yezoensis]|uniref:Uncharacterized protein n=1 Tax=Pyropia yezoensis TaxID=2788 RepID=A0ACC3CEN5_PYRYE|nr:hypothetical protein I4F81_010938 [Neopyropia yezoensis]
MWSPGQGSHLDDVAAARVYLGAPLTDADVALYVDQSRAPPDGAMDDWLDSMLRATFLAAPGNAAKMNLLINGDGQPQSHGVSGGGASGEAPNKVIARQNLPKGLTTVEGVLTAWEDGLDGLLPMRSFVGNKHPTIKLDRAERKQLNDHARIARKVLGGGSVEGIGREQVRVRYEVDSGGKTRTLKVIRVMLEHEARASKSAQA